MNGIINEEDIIDVMNKLAKERPLFHSEADFQHALGWMIRDFYPKARVRAEVKTFYPMEKMGKRRKRRSLDLLVASKSHRAAIELKYKTANAGSIQYNGEDFYLPREGAQDISRVSFLMDLKRLEQATMNAPKVDGYAIFLTNDHLYWRKTNRVTKDEEFRIHQERKTIPMKMHWQKDTAMSTTKGIESISLSKQYELTWRDYSYIDSAKHNKFRYLLLSV